MKNIVYFFSGTGNSLATAKMLSSKLSSETELRAINESTKGIADAERIGFIFPVYAWGLPDIVKKCVVNLTISPDSYIFAIATCGGTPGGTMGQLNRLLKKKGNRLSSGFTVFYESGNLAMEVPIITFVRKLAGKRSAAWKERADEICNVIERKGTRKPEQNNFRTRLIGNFFSAMSAKMFASLDKNFQLNDKCTGCGICKKICPVENISMIGGKPVWNHHCQQCLGCVHWCPESAIETGAESRGKPRYHNPEVTLQEMIKAHGKG